MAPAMNATTGLVMLRLMYAAAACSGQSTDFANQDYGIGIGVVLEAAQNGPAVARQ